MAQFKITESNKKSFFTDNIYERPNRNNQLGEKTIKFRPRKDEEIFDTNYKLQTQYRNSISELNNTMEDMDRVTQDFFSISGIYYNMNDYIPEVDDNFSVTTTKLDPFVSKELQDNFGGYVRNNQHLKAKRDFINNKINEWFEKNPQEKGSREGGFRDFNYYLSLRSQDLAKLEKEQTIGQKYNDGSTGIPGAAGTMGGIFSDPLILASIPASFALPGGSFKTAGGILKTALAESAIAVGFEIPIQLSAVSYNKQLLSDYGWKDASLAIAGAGIGGAVGTAALGGTIKGFFGGYTKLLKSTKIGKAKLLASEIDKMIDEAPYLDDKYADKVFEYINKNIEKFSTTEKIELLDVINKTIATPNPTVRTVQQILESDEIAENNPLEDTIRGRVEHNERLQKAGESLLTGENKLENETRTPVDYTKNFDQTNNVYREVRLDPDEIEVDPKTFQFKKEEIDPVTGVSPKLKGITEWDQDAANVVMVFEYADGRKVIADGHQRLALAKRIKAMGKQKPYMLATVRREVDGHTPEETMVAAMMINVHQGTATAADVAKILKLKPDFVQAIKGKVSPRSVLWENANGLAKLSPEAWQYYLNNSVPDRIASIVGDLVDDPELHIQVMDFISRNAFDNEQQIRLAIQDVISQGVSTKEVQDLFGTQTIKELLIKERAEILDKTIKELKKDKSIAGFLVNNESKISKKGNNKLDSEFNKKALQESALTIEKIIKLANMKGAISDELSKAAKLYKGGDKQGAINSFKETVTTAVRNGDLDRVTPIGSQRTTISEGYTQTQPDLPKETETNLNLKNSDDVHDGKQQYTQELGSIQNTLDDVFGTPPQKPTQKVELQSKTLDEIADLDDNILKNQAYELIDHPEIVRLREIANNKKTTLEQAGGTFDEAWQQKRGWSQIVDDLYGNGAEVKNKEMTVFIGLPASGKSTLATAQQKKLGALIVDSDFVKEHPNLAKDYDGGIGAGAVHDESKYIQELILAKAIENGDNIIIPIVGSSGRNIDKLIDIVKNNDYSLVVKYVEVDEATAITRNVKRISKSGRFVDPEYIRTAYKGATENYNKGKELADGYEKINLEGTRPVTKEIGGAAQSYGTSRTTDVGQTPEKVTTDEIEQIFNELDPEYKVWIDNDLEDKPIFATATDVLREINNEKKAIDFLEGCPGLR